MLLPKPQLVETKDWFVKTEENASPPEAAHPGSIRADVRPIGSMERHIEGASVKWRVWSVVEVYGV